MILPCVEIPRRFHDELAKELQERLAVAGGRSVRDKIEPFGLCSRDCECDVATATSQSHFICLTDYR